MGEISFYFLEVILKKPLMSISITVMRTLHLKKANCNPAHLTTRSMRATSPHVIAVASIQTIRVIKIFVDVFMNNQVLSYLL